MNCDNETIGESCFDTAASERAQCDDIDTLFLAASQQFKEQSAGSIVEVTATTSPESTPSMRFGAPLSSVKIEAVKKSHIPKKTRANTT